MNQSNARIKGFTVRVIRRGTQLSSWADINKGSGEWAGEGGGGWGGGKDDMQSQRWLKVSQRSRDSSLSGKGENYRKSPVRLSSDAVSRLRRGTRLAWDGIVRKKSKFQFLRVVYSFETWQPSSTRYSALLSMQFLKVHDGLTIYTARSWLRARGSRPLESMVEVSKW